MQWRYRYAEEITTATSSRRRKGWRISQLALPCCPLLLLVLVVSPVGGLDNGLALTPPMGWMSWQRFMCNTDCDRYPQACVNERLYTDMADRLAEDGWREAGYVQVNIDDCWSGRERDPVTGQQVADSQRFPHGIKWLAEYMHKRGLKLGLYSDIGTKTCQGYVGMEGHLDLDARTFASWDIDMLKVDGCNADPATMNSTYPALSRALNATGRPIVYSCSWPAYLGPPYQPPHTPYDQLKRYCNLWRNYNDISDSWASVTDIINHWAGYGSSEDAFVSAGGPGHWNDPDMLLIGGFGLSHQQERTQFALWAILAAPLLMSNDLRDIRQDARDILLNKEIIAVNQDPLGKQGRLVWLSPEHDSVRLEVWCRVLLGEEVAVVLRNPGAMGSGTILDFNTTMIGWPAGQPIVARDLYAHTTQVYDNGAFSVLVRPSGVEMYRLHKKKHHHHPAATHDDDGGGGGRGEAEIAAEQ